MVCISTIRCHFPSSGTQRTLQLQAMTIRQQEYSTARHLRIESRRRIHMYQDTKKTAVTKMKHESIYKCITVFTNKRNVSHGFGDLFQLYTSTKTVTNIQAVLIPLCPRQHLLL